MQPRTIAEAGFYRHVDAVTNEIISHQSTGRQGCQTWILQLKLLLPKKMNIPVLPSLPDDEHRPGDAFRQPIGDQRPNGEENEEEYNQQQRNRRHDHHEHSNHTNCS